MQELLTRIDHEMALIRETVAAILQKIESNGERLASLEAGLATGQNELVRELAVLKAEMKKEMQDIRLDLSYLSIKTIQNEMEINRLKRQSI